MVRNTLKKKLGALYLLPLVLLLLGRAVAGPTAEQLIHDQADRLLEQLSTQPADAASRTDLVSEIIAPHVDFTLFSRLVLGKHWRRLSAGERKHFEKGLAQLVIRTYTTALSETSGLEIDYLGMQPGSKQDRVVVPTVVSSPGSPPVNVDYKLYEKDGTWKVYDVVIEGISMTLNYRSVLSEKIRQEGIESVIDGFVNGPEAVAANRCGKTRMC